MQIQDLARMRCTEYEARAATAAWGGHYNLLFNTTTKSSSASDVHVGYTSFTRGMSSEGSTFSIPMLVDDNLCKYENKELEAIAQNPDSDGGYMKACLHVGVARERLPDGDNVRASAALQMRARFLAFAAVTTWLVVCVHPTSMTPRFLVHDINHSEAKPRISGKNTQC